MRRLLRRSRRWRLRLQARRKSFPISSKTCDTRETVLMHSTSVRLTPNIGPCNATQGVPMNRSLFQAVLCFILCPLLAATSVAAEAWPQAAEPSTLQAVNTPAFHVALDFVKGRK